MLAYYKSIYRFGLIEKDPLSLFKLTWLDGLCRFLTAKPHMDYHTGSIVRAPKIQLTNATESFRLSAVDTPLNQHLHFSSYCPLYNETHWVPQGQLPRLATAMKFGGMLNYSETMELNWEEFRPLNDYLGRTET